MKNKLFTYTGIGLLLSLVLLGSCRNSPDNITPAGSTSGGGGTVTPPLATEFMVNGYLPDWKSTGFYSTVDYTNLTIVFFAFIVCDANGNIITNGNEAKMTNMITAAHAKNTKAYLSFGGGGYYGSTVFYNMANNETSRKEFAHQVKEFCLEKGFDGFDVDWEGLANASQGLAHEALMTTLSDTLHAAGLGLAVTVQQGGNASYFTQTAMNKADLVQIMSYDATGTWAGSPKAQHSSYPFALNGISYWNNTKGIAKSKLVMGVPFYGYRFANMPCPCQAITYASIVAAYPGISEDTDYIEEGTFSETYFNGMTTLSEKVAAAHESRIPGIMIWEISQDASGANSLLTKITNYLGLRGATVKKLTTNIP